MAWSSPPREKELNRLLWSAVACLLLTGSFAGVAGAASGRGIAITPAFQQVEINSQQATQVLTINYTNRGQTDQTFRLSTADFGSLDETGGVAFIGQLANEMEHRYGLASWMRLSTDNLYLPGGSSKDITVTIENRESLTPGGHYAAVLATSVGDPIRSGEGGADVGVRQVLTSLILLNKAGGAKPSLKLVDQDFNGQLWRLPTTAELRFQNTGNVHLTPRGTIEIFDPLGTVVSRSVLNEESAIVLPESYRRLKSTFMNVKQAWLPGRYRVETVVRYDGTENEQKVTTYIWYAGTVVAWSILGFVLIAMVILAWWSWRRFRR